MHKNQQNRLCTAATELCRGLQPATLQCSTTCKISLQENPSSYLRQFFTVPSKTKYPTLARDYRQTFLHEKKPGNDAARAPRV